MALMKHCDVPLEVRDKACRLFESGARTIVGQKVKHAQILEKLGIEPDPRNWVIWDWLDERSKRRMQGGQTSLQIDVTKRGGDMYACLSGRPEVWGCGNTLYGAIGNLLMAHQDVFNIRVNVKKD
jgi:hypothetical protein